VPEERSIHIRRGEAWREVGLWTEGRFVCRLYEEAKVSGRSAARGSAAAFQISDEHGDELAFGAVYMGGLEAAHQFAANLARDFEARRARRERSAG
jgi:hypothetical protein